MTFEEFFWDTGYNMYSEYSDNDMESSYNTGHAEGVKQGLEQAAKSLEGHWHGDYYAARIRKADV